MLIFWTEGVVESTAFPSTSLARRGRRVRAAKRDALQLSAPYRYSSAAAEQHGQLQRTRALHRRPAHSAQGEPRGGWSRAGRWHTVAAGRPQQCCLDRFAVRVRPRPSLPAAVYTSQQPRSRLAREAAHDMRRGAVITYRPANGLG